MGDEHQKVAKLLRACLISTKEGVVADNLQRDYKTVTGHDMPYRKLGYSTLEQFLMSMPDVVQVYRNKNGEVMCSAVADRSTSHIASMVSAQKTTKKKKPAPKLRNFSARMSSTSRAPFVNNYVPIRNYPVIKPPKETKPNYPKLSSKSTTKRPQSSQYEVPPRFQKLRQPAQDHRTFLKEDYHTNSFGQEQQPTQFRQPLIHPKSRKMIERILQPHMPTITREVKRPNKIVVENYCQKFSLGKPIYRTVSLGPNYLCTVKINETIYSTSPEALPTKELAEEAAAEKAVKALKLLEKGSANPVTEDVNLYIQRIEQIVETRRNGVFSNYVESLYLETYKEILPPGWVNNVNEGTLLVKRDATRPSVFILTPGSATKEQKVPGAIPLPQSEYWDVYVCYVSNILDISVRLVDYNEDFQEMTDELGKWYQSKNRTDPSSIRVDGIYAALVNEEYFRVQVLEIRDTQAKCSFVDIGDEDIVCLNMLKFLPDRFLNLPFQAVHISLSGLEDLACIEEMNDYVSKVMLDNTYVACKDGNDDEDGIWMVLYDTSTDDDVDMNDKIAEYYICGIGPPVLPEMHEICEAYLSNISGKETEEDIYIRLASQTFDILISVVERLQPLVEELPSVTLLKHEELYMVQNSYDRQYYRALYTGNNSDQQYEVMFVDLGDKEYVDLSCIKNPWLLDKSMRALVRLVTEIPYQAVACCLFNLNGLACKFSGRLKQLASTDTPLLLRLRDSSNSKLPQIELFRRFDSGELVSINTAFAIEINKLCSKRSSGDANNNRRAAGRGRGFKREDSSQLSSPTESLNSLSSISETATDSLTPPTTPRPPPDHVPFSKLPTASQYFDIHVHYVANPGNFTVSSFETIPKLEELVADMTSYYSDKENMKELTSEQVHQGEHFAALHTDSCWYRVSIESKVSDDYFACVFLDHGNVSVISLPNIQTLHTKYCTLPAQSYKAKLAKIRPVDGDWKGEDVMYFNGLMNGKDFVSIVENIDTSEDSPVLELVLIDTSDPSVDVEINKILVENGRAHWV